MNEQEIYSWQETNRFLFGRSDWSVGSETDRSVLNGVRTNTMTCRVIHHAQEKSRSRSCNQSMSTQTARTETRVNHRHVVDTWWTRCGHVLDTSSWSIPNHPIYPNQIGCRHTPGSYNDLTSIKITFLVDVSLKALNNFQSSRLTKTLKQVTDVEIGFLSKRFRDLSLERFEFKIKYYCWKFQSLSIYLMCYAFTAVPLTFKTDKRQVLNLKRKIWKNVEEEKKIKMSTIDLINNLF